MSLMGRLSYKVGDSFDSTTNKTNLEKDIEVLKRIEEKIEKNIALTDEERMLQIRINKVFDNLTKVYGRESRDINCKIF